MRLNNLIYAACAAIAVSLIAGVCSVATSAGTYRSDPISGEWTATFEVSGYSAPFSMKLKLDGDKVVGTAESDHTGPGTLSNGLWKGRKLSFTLDFAAHESIAVTGELKNGKLAGEFHTEGMSGKWEARKK